MNKGNNTGGWRTVEIAVIAEKGKSLQVTRSFLKKDNSKNVYTKIHSSNHIITALFVYRYSQQLHDILEDIKNIPYVKHVSSGNAYMV